MFGIELAARRREGEDGKIRGSVYLILGFSKALRHCFCGGSRLSVLVFGLSPLMSAQNVSNVCSKAIQMVHWGFRKRCHF